MKLKIEIELDSWPATDKGIADILTDIANLFEENKILGTEFGPQLIYQDELSKLPIGIWYVIDKNKLEKLV